jgi:tRNA-specific 2-thiouridylase
MSSREKILVAMSGGVDSSVAALQLQRQGCTIVGAYMKNWINEDNVIGHCPWMQDIDDARAVCDTLGIEFRVVNLMRDYQERVVTYLLDGYARGLTPNPDIMCNREMKFGVFRAWARAEGFAAVATGHYARRVATPTAPVTSLKGPTKTRISPTFSHCCRRNSCKTPDSPSATCRSRSCGVSLAKPGCQRPIKKTAKVFVLSAR